MSGDARLPVGWNRTHNPKVAGSNPAPATPNFSIGAAAREGGRFLFDLQRCADLAVRFRLQDNRFHDRRQRGAGLLRPLRRELLQASERRDDLPNGDL